MTTDVSADAPAVLGLSDGTFFVGQHFGGNCPAVGEIVFNTSITGYQEIVTDASYHAQIVMFTFPHIGNVGCNQIDRESKHAHAGGIVIRSLSLVASNWRSECSLDEFLKDLGIPGICGIDTRQLTHKLRDGGTLNGCILPGLNTDAAVQRAREFPGIAGSKLAPLVSAEDSALYSGETLWDPAANICPRGKAEDNALTAVVIDCGVKSNIPRMLAQRGLRVRLLPYSCTLEDVLAERPDGVLVSNGPGDPAPCAEMVDVVRGLIDRAIPTFGICLGAQLLALAAGCRTEKMKFGHHGANHPVLNVLDGTVAITSQNHGFAISKDSLADNVRVTHTSLFDRSIQGVELANAPAFAFQGHPEASPGPHDMELLFDRFVEMVAGNA